ncbi:MAG: AraC family transcriptional regulator [Nitrospira sp.]|nr:AraC family transcriptional regulator [Nitrospira sp.]
MASSGSAIAHPVASAVAAAVVAGPVAAHSVAAAFVASAVDRLAPAARERVLAACGIAAPTLQRAGARVDAQAFGALWLAVARELDDEFFGLDRRRMKVGSFALLCRALLSHRSIGGALDEALRGFALLLDDVRATLVADGARASVTLHNRIEPMSARRFADETLLIMLHGVLCWLAGRRVPLRRASLGWPAPDHAAEYRRMFSPTLQFDAAASVIEFDAALLPMRHVATAASLRQFLRDAPQSVFLKQVSAPAWSERVRRRLRRGADWPGVEAVAAQWGISPATLRRHLAGEGTSWQRVVDEVRRDMAIALLGERRRSIEQVAASLGYGDARSLHRAFRKWTGVAPGAYRADPR